MGKVNLLSFNPNPIVMLRRAIQSFGQPEPSSRKEKGTPKLFKLKKTLIMDQYISKMPSTVITKKMLKIIQEVGLNTYIIHFIVNYLWGISWGTFHPLLQGMFDVPHSTLYP